MEEKELELRMYFFVPYNISPIQQAIQAGHAALEYGFHYHNTEIYKNFIGKWKTWIILNGGTTNEKRELGTGIAFGSLNQIADSLVENKINFMYFNEPDLQDALTAVCFVCDERVWNYTDYLDLPEYLHSLYLRVEEDLGHGQHREFSSPLITYKMMKKEEIQEKYPKEYKEWVELLGGPKNVFLRELIKGRKLA